MSAIDIVIVNWNSGELTNRCLASIETSRLSEFRLGVVTVVDNGSDADKLPATDGWGFEIVLVRNNSNMGFGAACNQGARAGSAEFLLFLNPDTELEPDTLEIAAAAMRGSPDIGVCGVKTIGSDGAVLRSCTRIPKPRHVWISMLGLDQLSPKLVPGNILRDWDHNDSRDVEHVVGAFYLVRRQLFTRLGGFDERYFVYWEDVDLSARVWDSGARVRFLSNCSIRHIGGGASGRDKGARLCYSLRSRIIYTHKHYGLFHGILVMIGAMAIELPMRLARGIVLLRPNIVGETLRGYRLFFMGLPTLFRR
jgi:N-acetylglucosaminyl-diphospho-decaprenol L-rhamnosyltransferase